MNKIRGMDSGVVIKIFKDCGQLFDIARFIGVCPLLERNGQKSAVETFDRLDRYNRRQPLSTSKIYFNFHTEVSWGNVLYVLHFIILNTLQRLPVV